MSSVVSTGANDDGDPLYHVLVNVEARTALQNVFMAVVAMLPRCSRRWPDEDQA